MRFPEVPRVGDSVVINEEGDERTVKAVVWKSNARAYLVLEVLPVDFGGDQ